jgi:hypothetical protein
MLRGRGRSAAVPPKVCGRGIGGSPDRVHTLEQQIGSNRRCRVQSRLADPHECWACKGLSAYGIMCTRGAGFGACARFPVCKEKPQTRMDAGFSEGFVG